jgi:hypothetical protein
MSQKLISSVKSIDFASSPYSASIEDDFILEVDASGGPVIVNLPLANPYNRRDYIVKKIDGSTNTVTIQPQGGETIDGVGSRVLENQNETIWIYSNGTTWYAISSAGGGQSPNGTLYVTVPAATNLNAVGEVKIAGTTAGKNLNLFTHTNGRLTYNGQNPIRVLVAAQASFIANGILQLQANLRVALNGAGILDSETQQEVIGTDPFSEPLVTTVDLVTNDYLEMFVQSPDFGVGVQVFAEKMVMSVIGIADLSGQVGLQRQYSESLGVSSITGTTAWQTKLSIAMPGSSAAGNYRIQWSAEIKNDGTNAEAGLRVIDSGGTVHAESMERMAGTPANQWQAKSGIFQLTLPAGGDTYTVEFNTSSTPRTTSIRRTRLEILRVP